MLQDWEQQFESDLPEWVLSFHEQPEEAVEDLLWYRVYLGHLQAAEPADLVFDWATLLPTEFSERLDEALAEWVATHWGMPQPEERPVRIAAAWSLLAKLVTYLESLQRTAASLRERYGEAVEFLGPFSTSPSRDALGHYLGALAAHQPDRSLLPVWWQLSDLPEGVPVYHARYALEGLRGLPPEKEEAEEDTGFRPEVVRGVIRLARALDRLVQMKELALSDAESEFFVVARTSLAALPFPARWHVIIREYVELEEIPKKWLEKLLPEGYKKKRRHRAAVTVNPAWKDRAFRLEKELHAGQLKQVDAAESLLLEERAYAKKTGDSDPLVRSISLLSKAIRRHNAKLATKWSAEAVLWEPRNPYTWSSLFEALVADGRPVDAEEVAWRSVERFPENGTILNGLAEVLKAQEKFAEAEAIYRETARRFPTNVVAHTGLAEVLKAQERLAEAEAIYRETARRFPTNVVAHTGLAEVLKAQERLGEAEAVYRDTAQRFPTDVFVRTGLAQVLKAQGRLGEAEAVYRETAQRFPTNVFARTGLAEVLKAQGRLGEAEAVYRDTVQRFPTDVFARNGLAEVLKAQERLDEAEAIYRDTVQRFPTNVVARNGLAEVLKAQERLDEAEDIYHETAQRPETIAVLREPQSEAEDAAGAIAREVERESHDNHQGEPDKQYSQQNYEKSTPAAGTAGRELGQVKIAAPGFRTTSAKVWKAQLLRIRARQLEETEGGRERAEQERERALALVNSYLAEQPMSTKGIAEKGRLLLEMGRTKDANEFLCEANSRFLGAPVVLAVLAQARRILAQEQHWKLEEKTERIVLEAPSGLRSLQQYEPLVHLQQGRAYLATTNGQVRYEKASKAFKSLERWLGQHDKDSDFNHWWGGQIKSLALAPTDLEADGQKTFDLSQLEARQRANASELDQLENSYATRQAALRELVGPL